MINTKKLVLFFSITIFLPLVASAQRSMTVEDLGHWRKITNQQISNNGKYVGCQIGSLLDDPTVKIYKSSGEEIASYTPAERFEFSFSSKYAVVVQTPTRELLDSLKLKKTKKNKLPMKSLIIRNVSDIYGGEEVIDSVKSYMLSASGDWLAFQRSRKDSTLYVRSLSGTGEYVLPAVKKYSFAKKSNTLYFICAPDTLGMETGLHTMNPEKGVSSTIKAGKGDFKQIAFNDTGNRIAFLYKEDKKDTELWMSLENSPATMIAQKENSGIPAEWIISEHGRVAFSKNGKRLFFGTAPKPLEKDSTLLDEYRPNVHVWTWNEHTLQTVQIIDKQKDLKKTYSAVYDLTTGKVMQLATPEYPDIAFGEEGNADFAVLSTSLPYPVVSMWEGTVTKDYYALSLQTGNRSLIKKGLSTRMRISPKGNYTYWYDDTDRSWYSYSFADQREYKLTNPETFIAWNEQHDQPKTPDTYGIAGWTENDDYLLLYDRYDIFKIDPKASSPPVNLTQNGRTKEICYRLVSPDKDEKYLDIKKPYLVSAFDERSKTTGYYEIKLATPAAPKPLLTGEFKATVLAKAKNTDKVIFTTETFRDYPELQVSDLTFRKRKTLTNEGEQQNKFIWGTAELTTWTSLDGLPLEGIIYKPAGFDPQKKYPMIVNFYERNSDNLYNYTMPQPHRSTVDYHLYTSNGYVVFVPDIWYKTGYPGESSYNCVIPGVEHMIRKGYINEKAIAAQGHSWGGYQVAYLATRTNIFAAIESGAPVVNMFSAYGGIRWQTGLSRAFQYEKTQSRIGQTPWEAPELYHENSPLFFMDKVQTPILIMHNDNDGHVPWYQGIEYFLALRRLQKPAWLLNYTGEIHWPQRTANKMDFQKRMLQFFNHYLKGEPMPKWMKDGVKAVEKDYDLGLEL